MTGPVAGNNSPASNQKRQIVFGKLLIECKAQFQVTTKCLYLPLKGDRLSLRIHEGEIKLVKKSGWSGGI